MKAGQTDKRRTNPVDVLSQKRMNIGQSGHTSLEVSACPLSIDILEKMKILNG